MTHMLHEKSGQYIRQMRINKGWNQERLSDEVGISVDMVSKYEMGRTKVKLEVFEKIIEALGYCIVIKKVIGSGDK